MDLDFPATVLLLVFLLGLYVLWKTHRRLDFDFSEMLRDEAGKPSSSRLAVFVCLAVSTWAIMYMLVTRKGLIDTWIYISYVAIWSGAKVAERGIDAYLTRGAPGYNVNNDYDDRDRDRPRPLPRPRPRPRPRTNNADDEPPADESEDESSPAH